MPWTPCDYTWQGREHLHECTRPEHKGSRLHVCICGYTDTEFEDEVDDLTSVSE